MRAECTPNQLEFHALGRRDGVGRFDGGRITSDGGGLLSRGLGRRIGLLDRLAACFVDHRNPNSIEHSVRDLVAQRVHGLALDYEDLNDHKCCCLYTPGGQPVQRLNAAVKVLCSA